jgi:DNA-directed RNA polymerase subunit K/omega
MSDAYREIDEISSWCDNQYVLALAIAKRVRKLKSGAPPLIENSDPKHRPFETAMAEIARGSILYEAKDTV